MPYFAVIDTETNWVDQVMSIGTVIADAETFRPVAAKYHILPAYCEVGGMYYEQRIRYWMEYEKTCQLNWAGFLKK